MFPGLTLAYWLTVHGLVTIVAVLLYAITSHVLQQRRHLTGRKPITSHQPSQVVGGIRMDR